MEKRLLLAFILSFGVLYGFRYLFPPPPAADKAAKTVAENKVTPPTPTPPPAPAAPVVSAAAEGTIQADAPRDIKVGNDLYEATVSNVGGVLKSFRLKEKKYLNPEGKPTELIDPYA